MKKNISRFSRPLSFSGKLDEACPDAELLEYILLSAHQNPELYEQFQEHFLVCDVCQRRIRLVKLFYSILAKEMEQPVTLATVKMAKKLTAPQKT
jgi:hypothetical protein